MDSFRAIPLRTAAVAVVAAALIAGCGDDSPGSDELANPASEYCVEQGGEVEIVTESDGEVGYCNLPDGTRVEEWEYYRANAPADE